jgi:hypothetical protein
MPAPNIKITWSRDPKKRGADSQPISKADSACAIIKAIQ